jgi:anti-repressor protein
MAIGRATVKTVDARRLHEFLEVGKHFGTWIADRNRQYGFQQGVDFEAFPDLGRNPHGGRRTKEYAITLDMAKELAMVERNERGREARRYFITCVRAPRIAER